MEHYTVSQLRARLEELEAFGHGDCPVYWSDGEMAGTVYLVHDKVLGCMVIDCTGGSEAPPLAGWTVA